jgi:hypothetical protein
MFVINGRRGEGGGVRERERGGQQRRSKRGRR